VVLLVESIISKSKDLSYSPCHHRKGDLTVVVVLVDRELESFNQRRVWTDRTENPSITFNININLPSFNPVGVYRPAIDNGYRNKLRSKDGTTSHDRGFINLKPNSVDDSLVELNNISSVIYTWLLFECINRKTYPMLHIDSGSIVGSWVPESTNRGGGNCNTDEACEME